MRVPLMPLALSLAVGGLLYAAYQGNKRLVDTAGPRPNVVARAATLPEADVDDEEVDVSRLDERCAAIAATAAESADAIESEVPFEEFLRRPVVAFVSDPSLRIELEGLARRLYDRPAASPLAAQRDALREARCQ